MTKKQIYKNRINNEDRRKEKKFEKKNKRGNRCI